MSKAIKKVGKVTGLGGLLGGDIASATVAGSAAKSALGKLVPKVPQMQAAATAPVMPTPDDDAIMAARRRRLLQQQARSGRQSTLLSNTDTLG